jgi:hypothetical protein
MFNNISREAILESWGTLIVSANGRRDEFFRRTLEILSEFKVPYIVAERKDTATSISQALFGKKRPAITVINRSLPEYKIFIMCRDYGTQLSISWYLVSDSTLAYAITAFAQTIAKTKKPMDVFQLEELTCWAETVHHATIAASKEIAETVNFDFAKVDLKSKGFLNVS